jgi:hypothetical protein
MIHREDFPLAAGCGGFPVNPPFEGDGRRPLARPHRLALKQARMRRVDLPVTPEKLRVPAVPTRQTVRR